MFKKNCGTLFLCLLFLFPFAALGDEVTSTVNSTYYQIENNTLVKVIDMDEYSGKILQKNYIIRTYLQTIPIGIPFDKAIESAQKGVSFFTESTDKDSDEEVVIKMVKYSSEKGFFVTSIKETAKSFSFTSALLMIFIILFFVVVYIGSPKTIKHQ